MCSQTRVKYGRRSTVDWIKTFRSHKEEICYTEKPPAD